jgi:dolichol-phosphate mannosyltransferase
MRSPIFSELHTGSIEGSLVFLDVDGTLLCDADHQVTDEAKNAVKKLAVHNEVVLVSNSLNGVRVRKIADELGVNVATSRYFKPHPSAAGSFDRTNRETVVIGDKLLTDGLFAVLLGATFVHVLPLRDRKSEWWIARIVYDLESMFALLLRFGAPLRFLISGGTAAAVLLLSLYIFTDIFHVWYLASSVIAFIFAFITSFTLHKFWTFQDRDVSRMAGQATGHLMVGLVNLVLNTSILFLIVEYGNQHYLLAQVLTSGLLAVGSFFIYKHVIFRKGKAGAAPQVVSPR